MIFKELENPIFPIRGEAGQDSFVQDSFKITHAVFDKDGNIVAGFGQQEWGDSRGIVPNTFLVLTKKEIAELKKKLT